MTRRKKKVEEKPVETQEHEVKLLVEEELNELIPAMEGMDDETVVVEEEPMKMIAEASQPLEQVEEKKELTDEEKRNPQEAALPCPTAAKYAQQTRGLSQAAKRRIPMAFRFK